MIFGAAVSYEPIVNERIEMGIKRTAKLSSKFQISIPKALREPRGWWAGQVFALIPKAKACCSSRSLQSSSCRASRAAHAKRDTGTEPNASD